MIKLGERKYFLNAVCICVNIFYNYHFSFHIQLKKETDLNNKQLKAIFSMKLAKKCLVYLAFFLEK